MGESKKKQKKLILHFLGELPLDKDLRIQSDEGQPVCIANPDGRNSKNIFIDCSISN